MVAMYVSEKPRICWNFTLCCKFIFKCSTLCCDNTVFMVWLSSGTKTAWLGLEKDVLA